MGWMDRASLLKCESGRIAIAVPFQTSCVIALMLDVSERLSFSGTQFAIVTSCLTVLTSRAVSLVFGVVCLFGLLRSEFGVVALIPAIRTILRIALEFRSGRFPHL